MLTTNIYYLTGGTGFLGGLLVKKLELDPECSKIYCPVRAKAGNFGSDRFNEILRYYSKASFIDVDESVPEDVTHIALCAYDTRFDGDLSTKVKNNVRPIVNILETCRKLANLKGIAVVSTAYVQLPLPYKSPPLNRVPLNLEQNITATQLYEYLLSSERPWAGSDLQFKLKGIMNPYYDNIYVFSKLIMEHVIFEMFSDLPICIVRPSMVTPSINGTYYGFGGHFGVALAISMANKPIMYFPAGAGKMDFVLVDDVVHDIVLAANTIASPSQKDLNGKMWHPIRMSCTGPRVVPIEFMKGCSTNSSRRIRIDNEYLRKCARAMERLLIRIVKGKRAASFIRKYYQIYDPFHGQTWDFQQTHEPRDKDLEIESQNWFQTTKGLKGK